MTVTHYLHALDLSKERLEKRPRRVLDDAGAIWIGRSILLVFLFVLGGCALWPSLHQDLASKPVLRLETGMHTAPILGFDVDGAEQLLVTSSHDKTARVWSLEDGRLLQTLRVPIGKGEIGKISTAALSPDGEIVAVGGWLAPSRSEQHIPIFDRVSGQLRARAGELPELVHHLVFSPDGRYLVAALGGAHGIRVFDATDFDLVAIDQQYEDKTVWAAFDVGGRLVTTSSDGHVRLYNASFGLVQSAEMPSGDHPSGAAFSPDGKRIAIGFEGCPQRRRARWSHTGDRIRSRDQRYRQWRLSECCLVIRRENLVRWWAVQGL